MRYFGTFTFVVILAGAVFAQQPASTKRLPNPFDSLQVDSTTKVDTTAVGHHGALAGDTLHGRRDSVAAKRDTVSSNGVDTVVVYNAMDSVIYSISSRTMSMYSRSDVKYKDMRLTADRIDVNWNTSVLHAFARTDTTKDTTRTRGVKAPPDTSKKKQPGAPVMREGKEEYHGRELTYNFQTKKGKIDVGETTMDQGYYHGEDIKKIDADVLFVQNGRYTTCDKPDPHYFFFSPRMKVMSGDKIVAEPVYLYIANVPVFVLPFAVLPNKGGRRSGVIAPAYGEDNRGRYLTHLGYYDAISDYMDLGVNSDLYTKGGWTLRANYQYALRYLFSGALSTEYRKIIVGEDNDPNRERSSAYQVTINHHQEIDPTMRMDANFTFASNNNYLNTINLDQALNQTIASNATVSKQWEGTPNSITLSVSRQQNLRDGTLQENLPSLSFSHSQSYPFRHEDEYGGGSTDYAWYENIGLTYSASAQSNHSKSNRTVQVKTLVPGTLYGTTAYEDDRTQTLNQDFRVLIAPKLGYFTISPNFSYTDSRTHTRNIVPGMNADSTNVDFITQSDWGRAGTISTGVSIDTRLYGILQPNMLGVAAFRHTLTPSLSLIYNKQIIGSPLPEKQMLAQFNLGNLFEMKTIAPEGKDPSRITLLNLSTGISYDFAADSMHFSDIPVSFRTNIGNILNVDGSLNYDLYQRIPDANGNYQRIKQFEWGNGRLARLTNVHFGFSTSLSGEKKQHSTGSAEGGSANDTSTVHNVRSGFIGLYDTEEPDFSIPWNLSLGMDYSETKDPPTSRSVNLRGDLGFSLTPNWKITASGSYDVTNMQFAAPNINISRDLHCWLMNFSWVPTGSYRHYQLEIRVKAPQLRDIKLTKSGSDYDLR